MKKFARKFLKKLKRQFGSEVAVPIKSEYRKDDEDTEKDSKYSNRSEVTKRWK